MTENAQIETTLSQGLIALKAGVKMTDLAQILTQGQAPEVPVTPPSAPAEVVLTDEAKKALRHLPEVFAEVQPSERRALSETEVKQVWAEYDTLRTIVDLLGSRYEDLKEIVRNHMDVTAEANGAEWDSTAKDPHGHYVLAAKGNPERCNIPGTNQAFSREYRAGRVSIDASVLDEMHANGEISREAYLAMTRERRVLDEHKAMDAAANKPELREEILTAIAKMTKIGAPGTSLFVRKAQ